MDPIYQTRFSSTLLTSVVAGIVATLLCMAYYLGYKEVTGFPLSSWINVSSLIFVINVLFVIIGLIYSLFMKLRKGEIQFIILFMLITLLLIWGATSVLAHRRCTLNHEFHQLLAGIVIIIGFSAFAIIPFLFHNKKFIDKGIIDQFWKLLFVISSEARKSATPIFF